MSTPMLKYHFDKRQWEHMANRVGTRQNVENLYSTPKEMSTPMLKYENMPITFI